MTRQSGPRLNHAGFVTAKAGWAQVDITLPPGLPMGGRGSRFTPGAYVLDPLMAQAIALEDATGNRTLWVSMDLIGLSNEVTTSMRFHISAFTGVLFEPVINFSHTHSGPTVSSEYYVGNPLKSEAVDAYRNMLTEKTVQLACRAIERLQPATIELHRGQSDLGINRCKRNTDGAMVMGPDTNGVYVSDLWVLDVRAKDDQRCVSSNYGCHAVVVYECAWDGISEDYPGACRKRLEQRLGGGVQCKFIQGLAGDVRPRAPADFARQQSRKTTPADVQAVADQLAVDVLATLASEVQPLDLDISAAAGRFQAPRDLSRVPPLEYWEKLASQDEELSRNTARYWAEYLRVGKPLAPAFPWQLGLIRLTRQQFMVWLCGEPVAEWQVHLRRWPGDEQLIVWGYCQETPAHLPTDELLAGGGYEVVQSNVYHWAGPGPFAPGLNDAVKRRVLALARQLKD